MLGFPALRQQHESSQPQNEEGAGGSCYNQPFQPLQPHQGSYSPRQQQQHEFQQQDKQLQKRNPFLSFHNNSHHQKNVVINYRSLSALGTIISTSKTSNQSFFTSVPHDYEPDFDHDHDGDDDDVDDDGHYAEEK